MSGDSFAVIASDETPYSVASAAVVLSRVKRIVLYAVSSFLRDHPGFFDRNATAGIAERLSGELGELGIATKLVDEEDLWSIPPAVVISEGRFADDAFLFRRSGGRVGETCSISLDHVTLIACARVGSTERKRAREKRRMHIGDPRYDTTVPVVRTRMVDRQVWYQLLDLLAEEETYPHLRVNAANFDYAGLGERLFATQAANFMALSGLFAVRCPRACIDSSITLLLDDDPRTLAKLPTEEAFDNYLLWKSVLGGSGDAEG